MPLDEVNQENQGERRGRGRYPSLPPAVVQERQAAAGERFKKLANERVVKVEEAIRVVGNLSSQTYPKTPEEIEAIFARLRRSLDECEKLFKNPESRKKKTADLF